MSDEAPQVNDQLVLISGESATGKSASLMNIENQDRWLYLNCESGKRLPFRSKFQAVTITDPYEVYAAADHVQDDPDYDGVIVDSLTYLMDMMESVHVLTAADTQKAWGAYQQFLKNLMQDKVAKSDKSWIFTGHTRSDLDESTGQMRTAVPVKGALKGNGVESFFSVVVSAKKMPLKDLKDYGNDLLTITPEEEALGFKHVFQTRPTKKTVGERIRGPIGLFSTEETFIDNDVSQLLKRLNEYYS